jgi:hypothetical protein
MLLHPNIWIGDTTATVHNMTPYEDGMINIKSMPGGITVGNGDVMETSKSGDIPCVICDKNGQTLKSGMVTEVALTKGSPFNLFSLTKMMKLGWTHGGDSNKGITLGSIYSA